MTRSFLSHHLMDETSSVTALLDYLDWDEARSGRVMELGKDLLGAMQSRKTASGDIETFLAHYPLTSPEGRSLMSLSEALLRIPDAAIADALISEKLSVSEWKNGKGSGFFLRASEWGLALARQTLGSFLGPLGRPFVRKGVEQTVRHIGQQFVVGTDLPNAFATAQPFEKKGYHFSYDMLGEGARTAEDADRYFAAYKTAIKTVGARARSTGNIYEHSGISVKLSALHPRFHWTQEDRCGPILEARLAELCTLAKSFNLPLTVDAEEADKYEILLNVVESVSKMPSLSGWNGLGLAIQAYDKRCFYLIDDLRSMAQRHGRRLRVRLVKGAYWDSEIKKAQMAGLSGFPVYTIKAHTDLSYLACAQKLLASPEAFYPMWATHNAQTVASLLDLLGPRTSGFEFQRLYGMGTALGEILREEKNLPVTIYAPVGGYQDLLPYLVRRMLENGANSSFVNKLRDPSLAMEEIIADPVRIVRARGGRENPHITLPPLLYGTSRRNSIGVDLSSSLVRDRFLSERPKEIATASITRTSVNEAFLLAKEGFREWNALPAGCRATLLDKIADRFEAETGRLLFLLQTEGKKTLLDAIAEIRETVDFCRYYAAEGEKVFGEAVLLPSPTGEENRLHLSGRGVFVCISPWNFPLAIFTGQVMAALMAGNTVIAKPAEQTPQIALEALRIMRSSGLPAGACQVLVGDGHLGAEIVAHKNVAGVAFTGSTEVARFINRSLAAKDGPIVPLIAETGGQNAMLVDSSALLEQVVDDVLLSAFGSAGQRCSALRVLYVQEDIAPRFTELLRGAMQELRVGSPLDSATDIGPVIDEDSLTTLRAHKTYLEGFAKKIGETPLPKECEGTYFAPIAYEIDHISRLSREVFGPILHVIRYKTADRGTVLESINGSGYGLTFGLHSRLEASFETTAQEVQAGNIYINRSMIGAVVGVQPFGGQGLSGTGPKAGGPYYLHRFATEKTITQNTTATGGNLDLMAKEEG
jgi:RHH-type proline utilization regulon transcriptional repressor/proline dehydrogenase/delta 1-pyrroline-5-carboxylate dehydrogenase